MHQIRFQTENVGEDDAPLSRAEQAAKTADDIGDKPASVLTRVVTKAHGVTTNELFHHSRSRAPIAATRQLAMYLMHVLLGRSLTQVGQFFQRDRTTVSYACNRLEDMREELRFDEEVSQLEAEIDFILECPHRVEQYLAGARHND